MARLSKEDWLNAGVQILATQGPLGLAIENLCRFLKVTKGSFYHHFVNQPAYKTDLLRFLAEEGTSKIIFEIENQREPEAKLRRLLQMIVEHSTQKDSEVDPALRSWASQDQEVARLQENIDRARIKYLEELFEEILGDPRRAKVSAHSIYATFIGAQHLHPPLRGAGLRAVFDEYLDELPSRKARGSKTRNSR